MIQIINQSCIYVFYNQFQMQLQIAKKVQNPERTSLIKQEFLQDFQQQLIQNNKFKYYKPQTYDEKTKKFDWHFQNIKKSPLACSNFQKMKKFGGFYFLKMFKTPQISKDTLKKIQPDFTCESNQIKATWIGHATIFLNIKDRINLIFDPMFQSKLQQIFGEKRMIEPPCKIKDLPPLDYVLISHDHLDHFNSTSIKDIYNKQRQNVQFIIGKNSRDLLPKESKFSELSWTQSKIFKKNDAVMKVTFVPACHWSQRDTNDMNQRLWGGYVIQVKCKTKQKGIVTKKIYFAGDTGYHQKYFKQLNKKFNGFDLCFLPIGAYQPNDLLRAQHTNPKQAVQIHKIINSKLTVGIHWGTFPLSHQSTQQVIADLQAAISSDEKKNQLENTFKKLHIGGSVVVKFQ